MGNLTFRKFCALPVAKSQSGDYNEHKFVKGGSYGADSQFFPAFYAGTLWYGQIEYGHFMRRRSLFRPDAFSAVAAGLSDLDAGILRSDDPCHFSNALPEHL